MENIYQAIFGPEGVERWINNLVWGIPAMALIFGTGLYLTLRCRAPQFLRFGHVMKNTFGKAFRKKDTASGSVSPFKAMCTALAASIGTGNIAGVSGAIAIGGPGAIWIFRLNSARFSEIQSTPFRKSRAYFSGKGCSKLITFWNTKSRVRQDLFLNAVYNHAGV